MHQAYHPPPKTLGELSQIVGAQCKGDENLLIELPGDSYLEKSGKPKSGRIYFIEDEKAAKRFSQTNDKSAALVSQQLSSLFENALLVNTDNKSLRLAFIDLLKTYDPEPNVRSVLTQSYREGDRNLCQISPSANVMEGAKVMPHSIIEEDCIIYPGAVIEPFAKIGRGSVVYPGASVGYGCVLGEGCIVYANAVVGSYGFGYHDEGGKRYKIPQIGNVVMGDYVEIGSISNIDRATIESTTVGDYTKIDSMVQIGHNTQIGKYVYIAGQCGIAGSAKIGDYCMLGGNAGISDHVSMGDHSALIGFSALVEDSGPNEQLLGIPAKQASKMWRVNSALYKLPDLLKRVKALEKALNDPPKS